MYTKEQGWTHNACTSQFSLSAILHQAQLCKELNEEKFKNQLLTRFVTLMVLDQVLLHVSAWLVLNRIQETSRGKPAEGSDW